MRLSAIAAAAAIAFTGSLSATTLPAVAGRGLSESWLVTYYLDPSSTTGNTVCVNFGKGKDASGVITGTWSSPSISGWKGQYVVKGEHFAWHGSYTASGVTYATYDVGDLISAAGGASTGASETSAGVVQVTPNGPATVSTGTAFLSATASCNGSPVRHASNPMTGL